MDLFLLAQEATSGGSVGGLAGWTGMASLSGVLAWLFFRHLPDERKQHMTMFEQTLQLVRDRDQQLMDLSKSKDVAVATLVESFTKERDADRESRHTALNGYQTEMNKIQIDFRETLNKIQVNCLAEMKLVREAEDHRTGAMNQAFEQRNRDVIGTLEKQTVSIVECVSSLRETLLADLSIRRSVNEKENKS